MKNRKKTRAQLMADDRSIYHKVILHNIELANKNTELSQKLNYVENQYSILCKELVYVTRKRWWQFWKWFN